MTAGIELKQELLKVQQVVGEASTRKVVRETITVPTGSPVAEKVISAEATVKTSSFEMLRDRVFIEGMLDVKVLYVGVVAEGAQPVQYLQREVSYELAAEIPGTDPTMNAQITVSVDHVTFDLVDQNTIAVEVLVSAKVKVTKMEQLEVVTDVVGPPDVKVTRELLKVEDVIGEQTTQAIISERLTVPEEKPDINRIISVTAKPRLTDVQVLDGQVVVEGLINADVMYAANIHDPDTTRLPVHFMEGEIRFTQAIEVPDARQGMHVQVFFELEATDYELIDPRTVSVEVVMKFAAKVTAMRQLEVVIEVTSATMVLDVEKRLLKVEDVVGEDTTEAIVKETLKVPREKPNIDRILRIDETLNVTETKILRDKVVIEGNIELQTLYVAQTPAADQPVHHMDHRVRFSQSVEIPGAEEGMTVDVRSFPEHIDFEVIDDRTFQVRILVGIIVKVTSPVQLNVVLDVVVVTPVEAPCPTPTMKFVTVQPGDTLWALARKYNTTVEAIVKANKIENPDVLMVGQVLQIPVCPPPKG